MHFKLQASHEQYTEQPVEIHGTRIIRTIDQSIEAEMMLCFQYDPEAKLFRLIIKRTSRGAAPRYDELATAKVNTVWQIEIQSEKSRNLLSALLLNTRGEEFTAALPYNSRTPVALQTILPLDMDEPQTVDAPEQPEQQPEYAPTMGPVKTLIKMWHEFRARKKKVSHARKTN